MEQPQQRSYTRPPPRREAPVSSGPERDAKVKWFNGEKGFGFVELMDGSGDAFVHASAVTAAGHNTLAPGMTMKVRVGQGPKGPQITEILSLDASTAEPTRAPAPRAPGPARDRAVDPGSGQEVDGQVKWYNPAKGFGFVGVDGSKDVFLHRSVLERAGLSSLDEGQRVRLRIVQGQKGSEATSIQLAD
jgi:CspA family cold shock protein